MHTQLNQCLNDIWKENFESGSHVLAPLYFDELSENGVLCIGMNPSFDERNISRFLSEDKSNENLNPRQLFSWVDSEEDISNVCIKEQRYAKQSIQYYKFHREIFQSCSLPWAQLDLYRYRVSQQDKMNDVCEANPDFVKQSIELFNTALRAYKPAAILVLNSAVVRYFENNFDCRYDDDHGHHWVRIDERCVPSVFSGQVVRSMAAPNKQLLIWYCKKFLDRVENKILNAAV